MTVQLFSWLNKFILPGTIIKVWIRNIWEAVSIQDQDFQRLSYFPDNMDHIIIVNSSHTTEAQFF